MQDVISYCTRNCRMGKLSVNDKMLIRKARKQKRWGFHKF